MADAEGEFVPSAWQAMGLTLAGSLRTSFTRLKIIKITIGVVAAVWALALIPQLVEAVSHSERPHAFGTAEGSILGILMASTISVVFFRKAFPRARPADSERGIQPKLSRSYNLVMPLIAIVGLAFEASSSYDSVSWARLCVKLGMSGETLVRLFVVLVWLGIVFFALQALVHLVILATPGLKKRFQPRALSHLAFFLSLALALSFGAVVEAKSFRQHYRLFHP
jgi:hypothetical protein